MTWVELNQNQIVHVIDKGEMVALRLRVRMAEQRRSAVNCHTLEEVTWKLDA